MPVAPYGSDRYRAWNRKRMREVRDYWPYKNAENMLRNTKGRAGAEARDMVQLGRDGVRLRSTDPDDYWTAAIERSQARFRGKYTEARDPEARRRLAEAVARLWPETSLTPLPVLGDDES
jgi:hypothetical protein